MSDAQLGNYWKEAGRRFGFRVVEPYSVLLGKTLVQVAALLPDFGAVRGMLLVSDYASLKPYVRDIRDAGFGFSVLDVSNVEPRIEDIAGLLKDWGWVSEDISPVWLR